VHLAALDEATNRLLPALATLEAAFAAKATEFEDVVKAGRTHLMDAVPVTLGQEFAGYAAQIRLGARRVRNALPQVAQIPLGGTAVGNGLNTHPDFAEMIRARLSEASGLEISPPEDPFEAQANRDALVELSGALKVVAVSLTKIAMDLALMGSGPRAGIGELLLPELQKGSSIMPGKVNPVIPEVVLQVGAQVIGNDTAITIGGLQGNFELNVRIPLIARNLLQSIHLLTTTSELFASRCVQGIEANLAGCERSSQSTLAAATALNPYIGYDKGAAIVKEAATVRPDAARGRARARRRRGDLRQGDGPAQDGARFVTVIAAMSAHVHSTRSLTVAALVASAALAACGGGSSSSTTGKGGESAADKAANAKAVNTLVKQAFGPNAKARSGKVNATIDIDVKGVPRWKDPIEITLDGSYELPSGGSIPDFKLEAGLLLRDQAYGAALLLVDRKAYIQVGTTGYRQTDAIASKIAAGAASKSNGLTKTAGMFYIDPESWRKDTRIVGDADTAGEATTHVTAGIRADRFFRDMGRLIDLLTALRVTEISGLPTKITPQQQRVLVRSVKSAKADVYFGKTDHVLRKAHLVGSVVIAPKDRKVLGGMKSAKAVADFNISDVGASQSSDIQVPSDIGSDADLQITLDALAESIKKARGTK